VRYRAIAFALLAVLPLSARAELSHDLVAHGTAGVYLITNAEQGGGGFFAGTAGSYRLGPFLGGLHGDVGLGFPICWTAGAHLGLALPTDFGLRLEALGTFGMRYYGMWGIAFLGDDPGTSALLPHAGATARLAYAFQTESRARFEIGALGAWERDLLKAHRDYSYQSSGWGEGTHTVAAHHVVGGDRIVIGLTLGAVIGI
jgi:hypothetical protein